MGAPSGIWRALRQRGRERVAAWARRRHGAEPGPVTISRRRVYILPTGLGLAFGAMVFAMLLAGLNYGNNLALVLTFVLAATGWVAMHRCHHNLAGLVVAPAGTHSPFAGNDATFSFRVASPGPRIDIVASSGAGTPATLSLVDGGSTIATVTLPTRRRGRVHLARLRIETTFPLGLFTAWTWIHVELDCLVYPRPAERADGGPPPAADAGAARDGRARGEEDFASLRAFRDGDAPRRIAWKAFARGGELVVKEYVGSARAPVILDLGAVPGRDIEERLRRLARWIVDAEERGDRYGLRVGTVEIAPGSGPSHRHRCLAPLATHGLPSEAR